MAAQSNYLYWLIVGCEAGFWLVLVLALATRYLLHREQLSRGLLIALPVLDVLLLAFTAIDLKSGATATFAHGLAAAYVGFTVAFGPTTVRWADQHFAHRFAGGPPPDRPPRQGWPAVRHEFSLWLRCMLAAVVTVALLVALIAWVGDDTATQPLHQWFRIAMATVVFWFIFGPVWRLVFFGRRSMAGKPAGDIALSTNTEIVRRAYAAFATGDVATVLGTLAPDVQWTEAAGGPYGGVSIGPDAVLRNVFMKLGGEWVGFAAVPRQFVAEGDVVVALGDYSGTYKATGKSFKAPFAHAWTFKDGLAVSFHQYTDTAVHRQPMT